MRSSVYVAVGLAAVAVLTIAWTPAERRLGPTDACTQAAIIDGELRCGELPDGVRPGDQIDAGTPGRMAPDDLSVLGLPVDVNTASVEELTSLPGVGPKIAQRIVEGRPYTGADDLLRVRGIGRKTLAKMRDRVRAAP